MATRDDDTDPNQVVASLSPMDPAGVAAATGATALSNFGTGSGVGLQSYQSPLPQDFATGPGVGMQSYVPPTETPPWPEQILQDNPELPTDPNFENAFIPPVRLSNDQANTVLAQLDEDSHRNAGDAIRQQYPPRAVPPIGQTPQTPENMMRHAIGAFTNPLMLMALVGGALTKQGARGALAAGTGVLQGLNEGNLQKAYLQNQKFRNSIKGTAAAEGAELADINAVLNSGKSMEEQIAMLDTIAQQHNDPTLSQMARQNFGQLPQFVAGRQKVLDALHKSTRGLSKTQERVAEEQEAVKAGKPPGMSKTDWSRLLRERQEKEEKIGPGTRGTTPPERQFSDDAIAKIGDEWAKGNTEPAKQLPYGKSGAADRAALWGYIADNYPDIDLGEAKQKFRAETLKKGVTTTAEPKAEARSLGLLIESNNALDAFERKSLGDFNQLIELAKKVDTTGIPAIERWVRAGRQATGDPDVQAFHSQWTVAVPEIARIITQPRLVGQLTDTARREVQDALPMASNVAQLQKSLYVFQGDFQRRRESYEATIAKTQKKLTPEAFPEPTEKDRSYARQHPETNLNFIKHFGVEP